MTKRIVTLLSLGMLMTCYSSWAQSPKEAKQSSSNAKESPIFCINGEPIVNPIFMPIIFNGKREVDQPFTQELQFNNSLKTPYSLCQLTWDKSKFERMFYRNKLEKSAIERIIKQHPDWIPYTSSMFFNTQLSEQTKIFDFDAIPAPIEMDIERKKPKMKKWTINSDHSAQFSQTYNSNNWMGAKQETSNFSFISVQSVSFNYDSRKKLRWKNTLSWRFDISNASGDTVRSYSINDDLVRYDLELLYTAFKKFDYILFGAFTAPIFNRYEKNSNTLKNAFLSPAVLTLGLGLNYNLKNEKGTFSLTPIVLPLSIYWKYVKNENMPSPNIKDPSKRSYLDIGCAFGAMMTWKITYNIEWSSRFYTFTNFSMAIIEFENTIKFNFNRFLSAMLYFYPRFDDKEVSSKSYFDSYFQIKESVSFGLGISF